MSFNYNITMSGNKGIITIAEDISKGEFDTEIFNSQLDSIKRQGASELQININSNGGNVLIATAVFDAIKSCQLPSVANVYGIAASAATVICLACDRVLMKPNALFMIHEPRITIAGTKAEIQGNLDIFDKIREKIYSIYEEKTGLSREELESMMKTDCYLTAQEALNLGFADAVEGLEKQVQEEEDEDPETPETAPDEAQDDTEDEDPEDPEDPEDEAQEDEEKLPEVKSSSDGLAILGSIKETGSKALKANIEGLRMQLKEAIEAHESTQNALNDAKMKLEELSQSRIPEAVETPDAVLMEMKQIVSASVVAVDELPHAEDKRKPMTAQEVAKKFGINAAIKYAFLNK